MLEVEVSTRRIDRVLHPSSYEREGWTPEGSEVSDKLYISSFGDPHSIHSTALVPTLSNEIVV